MEMSLSSSQVLCSFCEESISRCAEQCPYCQNDLMKGSLPFDPNAAQNALFSQYVLGHEKITQIPHENKPIQSYLDHKEDVSTGDSEQVVGNFSVISSLLFLLAGSFFFFFGALLKLFSKNGVFTLTWNAGHWPYYVFPSLVLLILGVWSLSRIDQAGEE